MDIPLEKLIFFRGVRNQPPDGLEVIEETAGNDTQDGVGRDGHEHAEGAAHVACSQQDDEDFQRAGLDAGGVDKRLIDKVVDQLGGHHHTEENQGEKPDVDVQARSGAVFDDKAQHHADDFPDKRSHIGDDIQDAGDECDADGVGEADAGNQPEPEEIHQGHSDDFDDQPYEIAGEQVLDAAGLEDCMIVVSNSLDEFTVASLLSQGACIDSFGIGERLITAKSEPVFGAVYKLAAVGENGDFAPRIKVSENVEKITNPGLKDLYRVYDADGKAVADMMAVCGEPIDMSQPFRYVDPQKPWKNRTFENCTLKNLRKLYVRQGKRVEELPNLDEIRDYVKAQLDGEIWEEEQRFENPHRHYLDMTPDYYELKMELLSKTREEHA